ncbi:MAG TPA: type II toxin-antitoxin system VapC family toxin [Acetobacteraceae bacterium]|nr:type II toxin-antitoxin system VapC family toxin [Acetobacteraceae bacterium]
MTRVLLDTHLLIWALDEYDRLPAEMRDLIQDPTNEIVFSVVSVWEIAIKARLGRTNFAVRPKEIASSAIATGFVELPLRWQAAAAVADLPMHHRDPFDRAIVAQAMSEPIHLYTVDRKLAVYSSLVRAI